MNPAAATALTIGAMLVIFAVGRLRQLRQNGPIEVNSRAWFSVMIPLGIGFGVIVAGFGSWYYTTR